MSASPGIPSRGLRSARELGAEREHGERLRYMAGCRCFKCRRSNSDYERERQKARAAGDWNGVVPAGKARAHLIALQKAGVGRRAIAAASDVAESVIVEIREGRKAQIRGRTERRLLAVTPACRADRAYVPAGRTWRYINLLLEEGFSKARIAQELGCKTRALQINRTRVLAVTAHRVARLYRKYAT